MSVTVKGLDHSEGSFRQLSFAVLDGSDFVGSLMVHWRKVPESPILADFYLKAAYKTADVYRRIAEAAIVLLQEKQVVRVYVNIKTKSAYLQEAKTFGFRFVRHDANIGSEILAWDIPKG